ncbi:MAG: hypothetical protein NZM38_04235 [Cytophagales bacterium]|nr:hypothetical protein [Cytophagales bacterium]MDW8383960.1 hypothetical protein [Flammeovirgaceae bacterium]
MKKVLKIILAILLVQCSNETIKPSSNVPPSSNNTSNPSPLNQGNSPSNLPSNGANDSGSAVKFSTSLNPLLRSYCNSRGCHNYDYTTTKNEIDNIIYRITLPEGDSRLMPRGGPKLSDQEIEIFRRWKADGFLQ